MNSRVRLGCFDANALELSRESISSRRHYDTVTVDVDRKHDRKIFARRVLDAIQSARKPSRCVGRTVDLNTRGVFPENIYAHLSSPNVQS